jgi:hypothetical protein
MRFLPAIAAAGFISAGAPGCSSPSSDASPEPSAASVPAPGAGTGLFRCYAAAAPLSRLKEAGYEIAHRGVDPEGDLLLVFLHPDGKFHVAYLKPQGLMCPAASGEGWETVKRSGT